MKDKKTPSPTPHRDRSGNRESPSRERTEYGKYLPGNDGRRGQVTVNERDPLPTKPPTRNNE